MMTLDEITMIALLILFVIFSFGGVVARSKTRSERLLLMAIVYMFALCALVVYR